MSNPTSIPVVINNTLRYTAGSDDKNSIGFNVYVGSDGNIIYHWATQAALYSFVMLERSNPNATPAFTAYTSSSTTVPNGLSSYLNDDYLLFFGFSGGTWRVPQGDLYELLMANGAGAQLRKLELWSTRFACGVSGSYEYTLISVPGTGTIGIEALASPLVVGQYYPSPTTAPGIWSQGNPLPSLTVELVPGADGRYTPIRLG